MAQNDNAMGVTVKRRAALWILLKCEVSLAVVRSTYAPRSALNSSKVPSIGNGFALSIAERRSRSEALIMLRLAPAEKEIEITLGMQEESRKAACLRVKGVAGV